MANLYTGFSTVNKNKPSFKVFDIEAVKQDLMNHFHTRRGERVMMPEFGSIIHELLMDPFDSATEDEIIEDAKRIISEDPRVSLNNISAIDDNHTLRLEILLTFTPHDTVETLIVEFEKQDREAF